MGSLKHLVAFHAGTGVTIIGVSFLDKACMDEGTSLLFSGVIRAIQDLMSELKLGDIKTFETDDTIIVSVQRGAIVVSLLMDRGTNPAAHAGNLISVATMLDEAIDWSTWSGEVTQFESFQARIHQVMLASPEDACKSAGSVLRDAMPVVPGMLGFVVTRDGAVQERHFDDTGDFELDAVLHSTFMNQFMDSVRNVAVPFHASSSLGGVSSMLVDYGKFTVHVVFPRHGIECFTFLRGKIDPLSGMEPLARVVSALGWI